jgi:predicted PurR-regulated permease PerM
MAATSAASPGQSRVAPILIAIILVVAILYWAQKVIIPLALAILLTFILTPIVARVQRSGLPRIYAVLLVLVLTLTGLGAVGFMVGSQLRSLAEELPGYQDNITHKVTALRGSKEGVIGRLSRMAHEISQQATKAGDEATTAKETAPATQTPPYTTAAAERPSATAPAPDAAGAQSGQPIFERVWAVAGPVLEPLATAGLVIVLVVFMLIRREDLRNRLLGLAGSDRLTGTTRLFEDTTRRLSTYLLTQVGVNSGFGLTLGIALFFIGVPYAWLWGFLATVLRFVPYVGTWLAALLPFLLSVAVFPGWLQPLLVIGFFIGLDLLTANALEPLLFGHSTGIAPVALLVAAAFWTWLWGPVGLVLSTPLTVCLVVLGRYVPDLAFLGLLLGDRPALELPVRYYQRLIAKDRDEADELVEQYVREQSLDEVYDEVLMPSLALARLDRRRGELTPEDESFIFQSVRDVLEDLAVTRLDAEFRAVDASRAAPEAAEPRVRGTVLACPAHHEAEVVTLEMFRQLLDSYGAQVEVLSTRMLASDVLAQVRDRAADVVFIAIMPPSGVVQARYLTKELRKQFPDLPIVVGYWGNPPHDQFDKIVTRLRGAGASHVTTSLVQSRRQIVPLLRARIAPATSTADPELIASSALPATPQATPGPMPHGRKTECGARPGTA